METQNVRFIHISDTHFGPEQNGPSVARTASAVTAINDIVLKEEVVDFVVHTGDVTEDGHLPGYDGKSTKLAASVLNSLSVPLFVVNGNHDDLLQLATHFPVSGTPLAAIGGYEGRAHSRSVYFHVKDRQFVILDARPLPINEEFEPRGRFLPEELSALSTLLGKHVMPTTIFLHYPPIELDCKWIDTDNFMLVTNRDEFHALLSSNKKQIDGVFFGHVHHGVSLIRDEILYASVAATSSQFNVFPNAATPSSTLCDVAFFNHVTLTPTGPVLKQCWCSVTAATV